MALSRKQWNNILIGACVFMVVVLSFISRQTQDVPADTIALFDEQNRLTQVQLSGIWLSRQQESWQCDDTVLNCQAWAQAWSQVQVSPLPEAITPKYKPQELLISITGNSDAQLWLFYSQEGLLKSPANNWYQVPPSLRSALDPKMSSEATN